MYTNLHFCTKHDIVPETVQESAKIHTCIDVSGFNEVESKIRNLYC